MKNTDRKIVAILLVLLLVVLGWIWVQSFGDPKTSATDDIENELISYQKIVEKCSKKLESKDKEVCDQELREVSKNLEILDQKLKTLNSGSVATSTVVSE